MSAGNKPGRPVNQGARGPAAEECLIVRAFALATVVLLATPANAADAWLSRGEPISCAPSLSQWVAVKTDGGEKVERVHMHLGEMMTARVRWSFGQVQDVRVAPHDGKICVVAFRNVGLSMAASN
jgi:hypothetical protein